MVKKETNVSRHSSGGKSLPHTQRFRVRLEARWIDAKVVLNKKYIYVVYSSLLSREPHPLTILMQLTSRLQYDKIMVLALHSVKSNNVDFLNTSFSFQ